MAISIDGVGSITGLYTEATTSSTNKLESILSTDMSTSSKDELLEVCKDFEAYFAEQLFKSMQKMVPESEESESSSSTLDMFQDMLTQEYAKNATEGDGLGIAQMLYEQMKRNYGL